MEFLTDPAALPPPPPPASQPPPPTVPQALDLVPVTAGSVMAPPADGVITPEEPSNITSSDAVTINSSGACARFVLWKGFSFCYRNVEMSFVSHSSFVSQPSCFVARNATEHTEHGHTIGGADYVRCCQHGVSCLSLALILHVERCRLGTRHHV